MLRQKILYENVLIVRSSKNLICLMKYTFILQKFFEYCTTKPYSFIQKYFQILSFTEPNEIYDIQIGSVNHHIVKTNNIKRYDINC